MNFCDDRFNLPGYLDATNFRYVKLDNKYLVGIVVKKLPNILEFLEVIDSIPKNEVFDMSIYVSKKNTFKILKELTYYISSSDSEQKTVSKNSLKYLLGKVGFGRYTKSNLICCRTGTIKETRPKEMDGC